jgi:pectin methylesterase-like acyl-CoA thioesterase
MSAPYSYRRVLRREMHSPRSALAIGVSVVVILLCAYVGAEIVLALLYQRALLATPGDMLTALSTLGSAPTPLAITAGIILMVIGLLLLIAALTPGRRARHQLTASRTAVVADNEVIASALARRAAYAGNANPDNTVVSVSARRAIVRVTPTSGTPVQRDAVSDAVEEQLAAFELRPQVRSSVVIASSGKVGA